MLDFAEEIGLELAEEGQFADIDDVKYHSTCPNISSFRVIGLLLHDVGVHVMWRPAEEVELLVGLSF